MEGISTYQTDDQTIADVAKGIFTGSRVVLGETHLKVLHGSEPRDLTYFESACCHPATLNRFLDL